jgi:glycerate kinase
MASASGLQALHGQSLDPMRATSFGTGQLIAAALDRGTRKLVVGVGGSATTDGGAGMLVALGARLLDATGRPLSGSPESLLQLTALDLAGLRRDLWPLDITVACDVDTTVVGQTGAARVFGPQKGASPQQVESMEQALLRWTEIVERTTGRQGRRIPGTGAAGGLPFALTTILGARILSGIDVFLALTGFDDVLQGADLVLTGEGCLDAQSLMGKAPVGVARAAGRMGVPVIAVAGRNLLTPDESATAGFTRVYSLTDLEPDVDAAVRNGRSLTVRVGSMIAQRHLAHPTAYRGGVPA